MAPDEGHIEPHSPVASEPVPPDTESERQEITAFVQTVRDLLNAAAMARPPARDWARAAESIREVTGQLLTHAVQEDQRLYGQVRENAGRAQVLAPAVEVTNMSVLRLEGRVTLDAFYLGWRGAHGGALPLLFDELMGELVSSSGADVVRTAYLKVDYRALTPVGIPLQVSAWKERQERNKIWVRGRLVHEKQVLCDAEALFIRTLN